MFLANFGLPWHRYTYSNPGSMVVVNCTAESRQNSAWSIKLPGHKKFFQFWFKASIKTLNRQGFYEQPEELGFWKRDSHSDDNK